MAQVSVFRCGHFVPTSFTNWNFNAVSMCLCRALVVTGRQSLSLSKESDARCVRGNDLENLSDPLRGQPRTREESGARALDKVGAAAVRKRNRIAGMGCPLGASRAPGRREQAAADEETSDSGSSRPCKQSSPVPQEDSHSGTGVSDGDHCTGNWKTS